MVLWLGTNRGLIKYNPKTLLRMCLLLVPPVCRWASLMMMPINVLYTGRLFFGGIDGLFYLDKEMATARIPIEHILLLMIGHGEVNLGIIIPMSGKALSLKDEGFFFPFLCCSNFLTGGDVEYSYMLDGFDKDWTSF